MAMNALRGQMVLVKLANIIHDLNRTMSVREISGLTGFEDPEVNDLLKLQKIPQDLSRDLEKGLVEEEAKAPILLYFLVSNRKAKIITNQMEAWLKEHPASNRGGWLWATANKKIRRVS